MRKILICALAPWFVVAWPVAAQVDDPAVGQYTQLEQMLALDRRCAWLPTGGLEQAALQVTRSERRAWLEASGRILAAQLVADNIDAKVAQIPCGGAEGERIRQQVMRVGWELGAEWLIRAQALQARYPIARLQRPVWFDGVPKFVSDDIEPAVNALRQQVPAGEIERAQDQALADASRWMLLLCEDWKAGLMHEAGSCPAVPVVDRDHRAYAQAWWQAADTFKNALWAARASTSPAP